MGQATYYRDHIDPEYQRWGRKYPRFPGVAECVRLLRSGKVRGAWMDIIVDELAGHTAECLTELIAAFRSDDNDHVRAIVLTAIARSRIPAAISFLADVAREGDPRFTPYAEQGLVAIGTREARTAYREATRA